MPRQITLLSACSSSPPGTFALHTPPLPQTQHRAMERPSNSSNPTPQTNAANDELEDALAHAEYWIPIPHPVRQARMDANAAGFVEGLPNGYDTLVDERGFLLSGVKMGARYMNLPKQHTPAQGAPVHNATGTGELTAPTHQALTVAVTVAALGIVYTSVGTLPGGVGGHTPNCAVAAAAMVPAPASRVCPALNVPSNGGARPKRGAPRRVHDTVCGVLQYAHA
ncbi:hypothetical protein K438DRAFT_1982117 [Mycena galopus ATCC 62051]|nr:hypothetical protein K438DRAFT_1982117 [Mycena galopus ATCC 62051]